MIYGIIYWCDNEGGGHVNYMFADFIRWIPDCATQNRLYSFWLGQEGEDH